MTARRCLLATLLATLCGSGRVGAFTCTQSDTVCSALGDLYSSTGGASWTNKTGWSAAAAGTATSYCTFFGTLCGVGGTVLTELCAPPLPPFHRASTCVTETRAPQTLRTLRLDIQRGRRREQLRVVRERADRNAAAEPGHAHHAAGTVRNAFSEESVRALFLRRAAFYFLRDFSVNNVTGTLPASFGSLSSLMTLCVPRMRKPAQA